MAAARTQRHRKSFENLPDRRATDSQICGSKIAASSIAGIVAQCRHRAENSA
jgi:hypothetical protein